LCQRPSYKIIIFYKADFCFRQFLYYILNNRNFSKAEVCLFPFRLPYYIKRGRVASLISRPAAEL
jgi:hypothetical protein